ncbi:cytochrome c maturation protein CcmE [Carboxydothermus hydrogenoformans]|uniref:Putative cytochrome c-type biogenesis protein CcmE n=1 Tax=Carboxydothermus hydrogenoformans (strain ATCC BAA-161 / DSM 6008 / Z-2901) TaxID=246194 RepID=Q3ACB4_CARHZ|nr:cytochrome c maturation protein CcmE [Carboxydothermus hydrogenoformans]ABB14744.1 putative cytochrome c-type biogenesis protein CcmE [Carboxydothermus hydrogenoformans Z-2901]
MNQRTKILVGSGIIVIAIAFLFISAFASSGTSYSLQVDEAVYKIVYENAVDQKMRIEGRVLPGSISWNAKALELKFIMIPIKGSEKTQLPVVYNDVKPDNLEHPEAQIVVEGKYDGKVFQADTLLVKCPSKYEKKQQ